MTDILSENEISELLGALETPEEPSGEKTTHTGVVKPYDFRSADKFPKEQIRTFNIIFTAFAQLFANRLSSILRTSVDCELAAVEECSFTEFSNSLPTPVILAVYKAPPMLGSQLIKITPDVAYMFISRLFGGASSGDADAKQFTEIELALLERVLRGSASIFNEAWEKVLRLNMQIERMETSPQFAQIVSMNDPVAVVDFSLKVGDENGVISLCIPHTSIEPIAKQLNTRMLYSSSVQDAISASGNPEVIGEKLSRAPVPLTAYFDTTPATVLDILNLRIGDVIHLEHKVTAPVTIKVAHIPKFKAQIGSRKIRRALKIVDIIKEEDEHERA
ncbi:MAG: flagellar motor switch protein FliM [Oscillospiraceae bacterium]|jgi:flagellar motor switch protein FliM|nr:flagellar motor switch protein FliM [Oscillospiraceae bacterium]